MATTTVVKKEENPGKTLKPHEPSDPPPRPTEAPNCNTSSDADAPSKDGGEEESKLAFGDSTTADNSGSATDTQKKIRRAERFGMPVQLSEQEKRNSRAERFGTGDAIKKSEEHKRKARAERFGLDQSLPPAEEEKKKARLARFSDMSSSLLQANGKGVERKAGIMGKAGEGD